METISADDSRTASPSTGSAGTGEWPVIPPVPTPTPPPPADHGPDPVIRPAVTPGPTPTPTITQIPVGPGKTVALRTRRAPRPMVVRPMSPIVWPRRFARITAAVILATFTVVTLPLWLAGYRAATSPEAPVSEVLALSMALLGAGLSAAVAWVVMVEMRARVGMVDTLGEVGAYEAPRSGDAAMPGPLRPFVQIPAQLGLLSVALALFIGATVVGLG